MLFELSKFKEKYKLECIEIAYIGANNGQEIHNFNRIFNYPNIHLFEPQKNVYQDLYKKFNKFDNLKFYNFALGSVTKDAEIFINSNNLNQSSSILKPKDHLKIHKHIEFSGTESIKIHKFSDLSLENVTFLNIDVQGYELEVLKGCEEKLQNINFIVTEVNRKELYENCSLVNEIDDYLEQYNFIRIHTSWWENTIPWGDALYIRKNNINFAQLLFARLKIKVQSIKGYFFIIAIPKKIKKFVIDFMSFSLLLL